MRCAISWIALLWLMALPEPAVGANPSVLPAAAFSRMPEIYSPAISPDGRHVAYLSRAVDPDGTASRFVAVAELGTGRSRMVLGSKPHDFDPDWCNWANPTRLLCGYRGVEEYAGQYYPTSRLVGVNADGSGLKVLMQRSAAGGTQYQDHVVSWTPSAPDTVLVQTDTDRDTYPEVAELNVYTGSLTQRVAQRDPIRQFFADSRGEVRLGCGIDHKLWLCFVRLTPDSPWTRLSKHETFQRQDDSYPIPHAFGSDPNAVYAFGSHQGRDSLYQIDLTDRTAPKLVYSHPEVDIGDALFGHDHALLAVAYETDRPAVHYFEPYVRKLMAQVDALLPGRVNHIVDMTPDGLLAAIKSSSDMDAGTYYIMDMNTGKMRMLGAAYPQLAAAAMSRMDPVVYRASDGVAIPGYLTLPAGRTGGRQPLVVLPHGGPISRDSWAFHFLVQFLASRGYAVLQPNFRGSSGYGNAWFFAAHQDWGGLTYSDIADGARWAISEGIADPQRICIVGWSFGGYAALMGAVRNPDLFRCAASIAGVSDLKKLVASLRGYANYYSMREQIGLDADKFERDSPARNVEKISIPILLVHGTRDWQSPIEQTRLMARALERAGKAYEFLALDEADHQLTEESDRERMLTALDGFLARYLRTP